MVVAALWSLILLLDLLTRFDRARLKLLVFMLTATGLYAMHWMFFNRQTHYTVFCDTVYTFCNLAVFPLYYIYVNHLTDSTSRHRRDWILVLPAVVMATLVGVTYGLMQRDEIQQFAEGFLYNFSLANDFTGITRWQALLHVAVKVIFALEALAVGVASFIKVHRYRHWVRSYYSNVEGKLLEPLRIIAVAVVVIVAASFVVNVLGRTYFTHSSAMLAVPSILFSALIFLIGYGGERVEFSMADAESSHDDIDIGDTDSNDEPLLDAATLHDLHERLEEIMTTEELFAQSNLRINDVAARLHTNRHYVYTMLKHELGLTFADYINNHRVAAAVEMMRANPGKRLNEVAQAVGFASDTSFYRHFKRVMGCSPSHFK